MDITDTLRSRWKWTAAPLQLAKTAMERSLLLNNTIRDQHAALNNDPKLTPLGRQDAMRAKIAESAPELHRTNASIKTMRAKLADRRKALVPPAPDKTDAAGAALRSELRGMLRTMKAGERTTLLLSRDVDPILLTAVLEAPNLASGIQGATIDINGVRSDIRQLIELTVVEATHPGALAAIDEADEAVSLAEVSARVATNTAIAAGAFPNKSLLDEFVSAALGPKLMHVEAHVAQELAGFGPA